MTAEITRVAIVEDHGLFRETIATVIESLPDLVLTATYDSAEAALEAFGDEPPDLVLVDLSLQGMNGIELVAAMHERWPSVRTVILSGHRRETYADQALAAGASGYVLKGNPGHLGEAIAAARSGRTYVSESLRPAVPGEGSAG